MTDLNKPGQPKDKEEVKRNTDPNQAPKNPQDRQNQGGADKSRQDQKNNDPSPTKE